MVKTVGKTVNRRTPGQTADACRPDDSRVRTRAVGREIVFNHRKDTAFVANVVDVNNRVTLIDTRSYLKTEQIIVDGVPQGLAVFPGDQYLAVITGSKTDFMAGGLRCVVVPTAAA